MGEHRLDAGPEVIKLRVSPPDGVLVAVTDRHLIVRKAAEKGRLKEQDTCQGETPPCQQTQT